MKTIGTNLLHDRTLHLTSMLALLAFLFGQVSVRDIDTKTLVALLALLILVKVVDELKGLNYLANYLIERANNTRQLIRLLLLLTFGAAMLLTNDVAILTIVPLFIQIGRRLNLKYALPITLITIYANLGSALTPIGNPQNLFIYGHYHLGILPFLTMAAPIALISLLSIWGVSFAFAPKQIKQVELTAVVINRRAMVLTGISALIILAGVLGVYSVWISLITSIFLAVSIKPTALRDVDYGIILTFIGFFIIVSALHHLTSVQQLLTHVTQQGWQLYLTGIISSQVISNVPAAVLLANFTNNYPALYLGVTVGGLGTLVASLANLLAFRQYTNHHGQQNGRFLGIFSLINSLYLIIFGVIGFGLIFLNR
ncbi:SLC13 family permease [Periweissella beninensis]|uniref:SLC13 family permease n=1 Tax=Periweissella beninensis TaxID=504936 RepID=UPI0021A965BF|nr:SLC13 family permease [Periweissella beninensis]MCT4396039.1 carboxylate transporter [Periweissella beninensis]